MNAPVARDWRRLLASIVALALIALAFTVASAQSSGGAMGGGDWGGGGAPSRSSGDYSSSSRPSGGPGGRLLVEFSLDRRTSHLRQRLAFVRWRCWPWPGRPG
jgi:hypothetical protein